MATPSPTVTPNTTSTSTSNVALTTIFTPPSSCFERRYTLSPFGTGLDFTEGLPGSDLTFYRGYTSDCYPTQAKLSDGYIYFSPGICPSAYSMASKWTENQSIDPTTYATCCPWYMHVSDSYYDCGSYPERTTADILSGFLSQATTITTDGYAFDTPIVIAWQPSDLTLFDHHPTELGNWNIATGIDAPEPVSGVGAPTGGNLQPADTSDVPETSKKSGGLSVGAKAGIGVGVTAFILTVAALVTFLFWRRRRAKVRATAAAHAQTDESGPSRDPTTTRTATQMSNDAEIFEVPSLSKPAEIPDSSMAVEADGIEVRAELEGDLSPELGMRDEYMSAEAEKRAWEAAGGRL